MKTKIRVLPFWHQDVKNHPVDSKYRLINTCSRGGNLWSQLSPFKLGPCRLYSGFWSMNMENAWQYSKVYEEHVRCGVVNGKMEPVDIRPSWYLWSALGWSNERAVRYPMGKGSKPLFSYWKGECLTYVEARKAIYGPLYAEAVQKTDAFRELKGLIGKTKQITLMDFDAYDHHAAGASLTDVLNNPSKKMGHAFVLAMLLTDDPALNQMELRT